MILVTGGTGLVGSHLLYFLLQEHETVRAIYREKSDREKLKQVFGYYMSDQNNRIAEIEKSYQRIEWVLADINDIPALEDAFKGITHVYHAAAMISFDPTDFRKLKKINIEGTANIVNQCLLHNITKLCYVSSIATLGKKGNGAKISEDTDWNPEENNSVYAISKYGAEMEVWRGTQEGLNAVIVNPGVIFGAGFWDTGSGLILKNGANGEKFYTSGGTGIVDVVDVVKSMQKLMQSTTTHQRYILVSKNITYKDLLAELATSSGNTPPQKFIKKWQMTVLSWLDWISHVVLKTNRKLPKTTVQSLYETYIYDNSKIKNELFVSFTAFEDTVSRVVNRYKSES